MAYNDNFDNEGGNRNMWSSGSHGGSQGGYSHSYDNNDGSGSHRGGSYRGSYGNNNPRRGGGGGGSGGGGGGRYGFRRQNDGRDVQILRDTIFIQNLPKNITQEELVDVFSTVGTIKTDDRSGGPKVWIHKDRDTGEGNGRATVTYEDDDTANKAIAEYNDQRIEMIDSVVRVQLAQRRNRNDNDRGGYRGGRSNWDNNNSRQGFNSGGGNRWGGSRGGGFNNRNNDFQGRGDGESFRENNDFGGSHHGSRGSGSYRGASRGAGGSSNYAPY